MPERLPRNMQSVEQRVGGQATAPPPPPLKREFSDASGRKLIERKAPILFSFKATGELVEGILHRIDRIEVHDKPVTQYTLIAAEATFKILGTYDIDSKLRPDDIGKFMQIIYARDNHNVVKNGNPMREFEIRIEEKSSTFKDGTTITDADIPF